MHNRTKKKKNTETHNRKPILEVEKKMFKHKKQSRKQKLQPRKINQQYKHKKPKKKKKKKRETHISTPEKST